jgi:arsenite/tail-anchored protein-transporting ATPase
MNLPGARTRNLLFTGKGGVGKTSIACATAIALADEGKRVLLVSTDPASNLDEVLLTPLDIRPTAIDSVHGLFAMNVDPVQAAKEYRERVVGPYRDLLPEAAVNSIEEQLSGACTVEIAAFDEFAKLLGDSSVAAEYDHVIFDTAPTGHTLRLLQLPAAWSGFIQTNVGGTSCLGPLAGLQAQQTLYENTVKALCESNQTTVYLVTRPERSAFAEADRTRHELEALGLRNQHLIVNGFFLAQSKDEPIAAAMERRAQEAMSEMPAALTQLPTMVVGLAAHSLVGVEALRKLGEPAPVSHTRPARRDLSPSATQGLSDLLPQLAASGKGVIMTMGKGGVGKTTIAAAIAVQLAHAGHEVLLTTTDPAAHVAMSVGDSVPGLHVTRIDPEEETRAYTAEVLAESGSDLDEKGRALLQEDLRSPCTEEIAVFRAFARSVDAGNHGFVVIDTAPTGHTLLLLDAAEAYHRDVARNLSYIPDSVRRLLPQLRDPEFTKILIVTLPEATPVHEAARLQEDLERARITPYAWVVNQSLMATDTRDPVLSARADLEPRYVNEVQTLTRRAFLIPWLPEAPVGTERLLRMCDTTALEQAEVQS